MTLLLVILDGFGQVILDTKRESMCKEFKKQFELLHRKLNWTDKKASPLSSKTL